MLSFLLVSFKWNLWHPDGNLSQFDSKLTIFSIECSFVESTLHNTIF